MEPKIYSGLRMLNLLIIGVGQKRLVWLHHDYHETEVKWDPSHSW